MPSQNLNTSRDILILGDLGQVGWELNRALSALGDRVQRSSELFSSKHFAPEEIRKTLLQLKPRLILNATAYTAVDLAEKEKGRALEINATLPGLLAETAKEIGSALVHFSTDYVYDGTLDRPYTEEDAPHPLSVYGQTKLLGDQLLDDSGALYLNFRTSWVYGSRKENFYLTMRQLMQEKDELRIVDDQQGAPTWCRSIAEATVGALQSRLGERLEGDIEALRKVRGVYHMTCGGSTTWFGFAKSILENLRLPRSPKLIPITTRDYPTPATRPKNSLLSNQKLNRTFGITLPTWQDALTHCMQESPDNGSAP